MVIYADILIITNFIVDYFLLSVTGKITKRLPRLSRRILSALFAASGALIIFLPEQNAVLRLLFRLLFSILICLINFGYESVRRLIFSALVFLAVTTCFAGSMIAFWYIFSPPGMVINNSVVYFDISPIFLIVFSVIGFLIFTLFSFIFGQKSKVAKRCSVTVTFHGRTAEFNAIIDSGNSLTDSFTGRPVIIADKKEAVARFGELSPEIYKDKYRAIPCGTVSGTSVLDGFRCDAARITTEDKTFNLSEPILAISKTPLTDCEAIVNPLDCT